MAPRASAPNLHRDRLTTRFVNDAGFDAVRSTRAMFTDARNQAGDHLRREGFECGHAVATFANHFRDLFIRHLALPFGTREILSAHHGALRSITSTDGSVTCGAIPCPRELHEALVWSTLAGRTRASGHLTWLSCRLFVIRCLPLTHFARGSAASGNEEQREGEKACASHGIQGATLFLHGDEMREGDRFGERFSEVNDHDGQCCLSSARCKEESFRKASSPWCVDTARTRARDSRDRIVRRTIVQTNSLVITARRRLSRRARLHQRAYRGWLCP